MRNRILLGIAFLIYGFSLAQTVLSGSVTDSENIKLSGATVIVTSIDSESILSYTITNADGLFELKLSTTEPKVLLSVSYLGFEKNSMVLENKTQNIPVSLKPSQETLKEVVVEAQDIEQKGDTLNYSVSAFKDQKDRVIADVLKKMPGITVMPDGQINYLGRPIEKYYIEGMDMLEGRYNLANENISANDVVSVQVLENHQPIKVLDSVVFSDRTSLNIKLKNNVSLSGSVELGGGFAPTLFKTNITPLLFTKKQQALASYQYDNTGKDLNRAITDFSSKSFITSNANLSNNFLAIRGISKPPFSSDKWLDNNDHLGSLNYLYRLKDETDIKLSLAYLNSVNEQSGTRSTTYITDETPIHFNESIQNTYFKSRFQSKVTLERNKNKSYLKNTLSYNGNWDTERGLVVTNQEDITQDLLPHNTTASNDLKLIFPVGKQLITFDSYVKYASSKENLKVSPGQFEDAINHGNSYNLSNQHLKVSQLFSENTAGIAKKLGGFSIAPMVGVSVITQNLNSELEAFSDTGNEDITSDFQNDTDFLNTNLFVTNTLQYKNKRLKINLESPLFVRRFQVKNQLTDTETTNKKVTFEPNLRITQKLSPFWEAKVGGQIENQFSNLNTMFEGYILENYLYLVKYNGILQTRTNRNAYAGITYRNAMNSWFLNLTYSAAEEESNILFNTTIADNGSLQIESLQQDNTSTSNNLFFNGSKYFKKLSTTAKFGVQYSFMNTPQIINNVLSTYKTVGQNYDVHLESQVTNHLSITAKSMFNISELNNSENSKSEIQNWQNSFTTFIYFTKKSFVNIDLDHFQNKVATINENNFFLNLGYQFTFSKYNIDAKLAWNNVLNTKSYIRAINSEFYSTQNSFIIRPSQVLLSLQFNL